MSDDELMDALADRFANPAVALREFARHHHVPVYYLIREEFEHAADRPLTDDEWFAVADEATESLENFIDNGSTRDALTEFYFPGVLQAAGIETDEEVSA